MEDFTGTCLNCFSATGGYDVCPYCGHVAGTPPQEAYLLHPGVRLWGRYIIGTVLGMGGFGATYKALDTRLNTIVAVKEFFPQSLVSRIPGETKVRNFSGEKQLAYVAQLGRFLDEARNMAKFTGDEHIVNVFDFFEDNGTAYIVMEYLDGMTLKEYMAAKGGRLPPEEAMAFATALLKAVESIHQKGIIHRDISPDNIYILRDGRVKVLDFGAARFAVRENAELTQNIVVKKGYAPPEQYRSNMKQGPWTDIYAVGATLYKMLTGITPEESIERYEKDTLARPTKTGIPVDPYVERAILKAMAVKPEVRFKSASEMLAALENRTVVDLPESTLKKRRLRNVLVMALAVVSVAVAGGLIAWQAARGGPVSGGTSLADVDIEPGKAVWVVRRYEYNDDEVFDLNRELIADFNEKYPDYEIELRLVDDAVFDDEVLGDLAAPDAPVICNALEEEDAADLSLLYNALDTSEYLFLAEWEKLYPSKKAMPTSFDVMVAYGNPARAKDAGAKLPASITSLSQVNDFAQAHPKTVEMGAYQFQRVALATKPGAFKGGLNAGALRKDFETYADLYKEGAYEDEYDQLMLDVGWTNTNTLTHIQSRWPGNVELIPVTSGGSMAAWLEGDYTVNVHADENEQKIGMLFIHFLMSEYAQTKMYVHNLGNHPLHKSAFAQQKEIHPDLAILDNATLNSANLHNFWDNRGLPWEMQTEIYDALKAGGGSKEVLEILDNFDGHK